MAETSSRQPGTDSWGPRSSSQPWTGSPPAYPTHQSEAESSDTATSTSSDDGTETLPNCPDLSAMSEAQAAEALFYQYRTAKRNWRRFTAKPVRKFRRHFKKTLRRYGKGRSKGKGRGFFFTEDEVQVYLKGKGKGNRAHTSGKGFGRKKNPRDRNGDIMKCSICGSDEHFRANCPQGKGGGKSSGAGAGPSFAGLAMPPGNLRQSASGSGSRVAEAASSRSHQRAASPPWEDDIFEPPRDLFAGPTFVETEGGPHESSALYWRPRGDRRWQPKAPPSVPRAASDTQRSDPVYAQDPWGNVSYRPMEVDSEMADPNVAWASYRGPTLGLAEDRQWATPFTIPQQFPGFPQRFPGFRPYNAEVSVPGESRVAETRPAQRVTRDDELSETRSWSVRSHDVGQSSTGRQVEPSLPPVPGLAEMAQPPLQRRSGQPNISDTQLLRVLHGQHLTAVTRKPPQEEEGQPPIFMDHYLPLSSGPSRSAYPASASFRENSGQQAPNLLHR